MDATSAADNVLAYIIYIIKQIAESIEHGIRRSLILYGIRVDDDPQSERLHFDVNIRARDDRVAIVVYGPRGIPVDMNLLSTEHFDFRILGERL